MHYTLGKASELKENHSKGYTLSINNRQLSLFVVHSGGKFYAYENHCPHTGVNLNWQPDQFLDITEQHIQCATHGALFRIEDGLCEWGPCLGQGLRHLNIEVKNGELVLVYNEIIGSQTSG